MLVPVFVAANVGVTPIAGLFPASRSVIVTVELAVPSAVIELVPVMLEFPATGALALKTTGVVTPVNPAGAVMESVFVSATVDLMTPVDCPEASVVAPGWVSVFPLPVAAKVVVTPLIGLLFASRIVIRTLDCARPSAVVPELGVAVMVEFAADAPPGMKVTEVASDPSPEGVAKLTVFVSATVAFKIPEVCPLALVAAGWVSTFPVPVALSVGRLPTSGLLKASRRVIKSTDPAVPFAVMPVLGEARSEEFAARAVPATNTTLPSDFVTGDVIVRVFVSAKVEFSVQLETPEAFVPEQVP